MFKRYRKLTQMSLISTSCEDFAISSALTNRAYKELRSFKRPVSAQLFESYPRCTQFHNPKIIYLKKGDVCQNEVTTIPSNKRWRNSDLEMHSLLSILKQQSGLNYYSAIMPASPKLSRACTARLGVSGIIFSPAPASKSTPTLACPSIASIHKLNLRTFMVEGSNVVQSFFPSLAPHGLGRYKVQSSTRGMDQGRPASSHGLSHKNQNQISSYKSTYVLPLGLHGLLCHRPRVLRDASCMGLLRDFL